jgi:hypothetical protein
MKQVANNTLFHKDLELSHKVLTTFEYSFVIVGKPNLANLITCKHKYQQMYTEFSEFTLSIQPYTQIN